MFEGVYKKLERAGYFLSNLKALEEAADGLAHVATDKQQEMRANLDGFFFEIISAKDFFLQGINNIYVHLPKDEATRIDQLKRCLDCSGHAKALDVVKSIEKQLADRNSWLWKLNNYRNSATHRELLHLGIEAEIPPITVDKDLFDKIKQGKVKIKLISKGEESKITPDTRKINIPPKNIRTYLFKDPEDPNKGNADIEVIPYCEQSLETMKGFLETLYAQLDI